MYFMGQAPPTVAPKSYVDGPTDPWTHAKRPTSPSRWAVCRIRVDGAIYSVGGIGGISQSWKLISGSMYSTMFARASHRAP